MIIRCYICDADPAGRWKQPAMMIFSDPYREESPAYACRDHLSPRRAEEIERREKDRWWGEGQLR